MKCYSQFEMDLFQFKVAKIDIDIVKLQVAGVLSLHPILKYAIKIGLPNDVNAIKSFCSG